MDIETIIMTFSYLGIFVLMIINGIGPFVPSQWLYIITGYFIGSGSLLLVPVIFFGAVGNTIGNIILYELVRFRGLHYILKWNIFPKKEIEKITVAMHKKGIWFLFVGKLLPALKVFVPAAAAIAKVKRKIFIPMMLVASVIWTFPFIAIGYYFGKSSDVFGPYAIALILVALVVMTLFYRYINSKEVLEEIGR
jgi:membrane protein DedA with SNARE-associated domain